MSITADYSYFSPELAECFEEAFERADVAPDAIGQGHIDSALRSTKFLFAEWQTYGIRQWNVTRITQTLTARSTITTDFDLPAGTLDIFSAVLRRNSRDTPMYPMSRAEYLETPDKTAQGRPSRYFIDKRYDRSTVTLWQAPENSTDIMVMDIFKQTSNPGVMANTLQLPPYAHECFVAGLAMRLAQKFNIKKYRDLRDDYGGQGYPERLGGKIFHMRAMSSETSDLQFVMRR